MMSDNTEVALLLPNGWTCKTELDGSTLLMRGRSGQWLLILCWLIVPALWTLLCLIILMNATAPFPVCVGWTLPGWAPAVPPLIVEALLLGSTAWMLFGREEWWIAHNQLTERKSFFGWTRTRCIRNASLFAERTLRPTGRTPASRTAPSISWQLWARADRPQKILIAETKLGDAATLGKFIALHTGWPFRERWDPYTINPRPQSP